MRIDTMTREAGEGASLDRYPRGENRPSNDGSVRRRSSGTAEMHAQIAVSVFVRAIQETVRRIGVQRYNQRDGRDESDNTDVARTRAQDEGGRWLSMESQA